MGKTGHRKAEAVEARPHSRGTPMSTLTWSTASFAPGDGSFYLLGARGCISLKRKRSEVRRPEVITDPFSFI